jgi:hypothetical protein
MLSAPVVAAMLLATAPFRFTARVDAASANAFQAQKGRSVSVSVQPPAATEIWLFSAGTDGKVLTTTDQTGKGSFDSSTVVNLGNLAINEETCKGRRRVLLVASNAKSPQNRECKTTPLGTFVGSKDVVLNVRLSGSFTAAIEAVPIPEPTAPPSSQPAATTKQTGANPATPSAGVVFRDDFTKPTPDAAWKIDLEDKDRWAIGEGELVIVTQPRTAAKDGSEPGVRNRFVLDRDLPVNYTITTRVTIAIVRNGNTVALRVRTSDGSSVALGYGGYLGSISNRDYRRPFFGKMLGGQYAAVYSDRFWDRGKPTQVDMDGTVNTPEALWLRLEKKGFTFIGSFSFDGDRFEKIGEQTLVRTDGSRLDLVAYDQSRGVETGAKFDYVEVIR